MRTRVGYAGGTQQNPTYYNLGDHTETIQIDYDPEQITYAELLDVFWDSHDPTAPSWSRQYMSAIFFENSEQQRLAEASKQQAEERLGRPLYTEILSLDRFYLAEDYHQKYYLRRSQELMAALQTVYPDDADMVNSTAAARLNGYVGGYGTLEDLQQGLEGVSPQGACEVDPG